jgi:hypothetical protein
MVLLASECHGGCSIRAPKQVRGSTACRALLMHPAQQAFVGLLIVFKSSAWATQAWDAVTVHAASIMHECGIAHDFTSAPAPDRECRMCRHAAVWHACTSLLLSP